MQVSAASFDGACSLCIAGQYNAEDLQLLDSFLNQISAEITAYTKENG